MVLKCDAVGSRRWQLARFQALDDVGMLRVVAQDVVLHLEVIQESQLAVGALTNHFIHASMIGPRGGDGSGLPSPCAGTRPNGRGRGPLALSRGGTCWCDQGMTETFSPAEAGAWLAADESRLRRAIADLDPAGLADHSAEEDLGEVASASQHPADVASETFEREVEFGLLEDFQAALAEIEAARRRLETGVYGRCERCREPIAPARLEAVPATRFCRDCADTVEHEWARDVAGRRRRGVLVDAGEFLSHDDELDGADHDQVWSQEELAITRREERAG